MKSITQVVKMVFGKLDSRHIQLALLVLSLSLFVLGAGAPGSSGGIGGW